MSDDNTNKTSSEEIISIPLFLGNNEITDETLSEEIISVPSFLARDYAASPTACDACEYWLCVGPCQAEQDDACGTGEWCSQCTCQGWETCTQCTCQGGECGGDEEEPCACAGGQGQYPCDQECWEGGCGECDIDEEEPCACIGGQGQYPSCTQECSECDACEDCMDCQYTCMSVLTPSFIDPWDWFADDATASAYYAITENGPTSSFSRNVWNNLVDYVHTIRVAAKIDPEWDERYADYSSTRMTYVDSELTAVRFNSLWININRLWATGLTEQSKGDVVYGSYFISLTTALNNYIAYILRSN